MVDDPDPSERQAHLATLRADRDIRAWYKDHRSTHTAEIQLVQLELFLRRLKKTHVEIAEMGRAQKESPSGKDRRLQELVQEWVDCQRKAGRPDSYIATNWAAVRSWLKFNEAAPQWAPKLRVRRGATLGNETVPTQQDLARILSVLSTRDRVIALLMAHSGVRPGVMGNRYETNGLRLRDLPDLDVRRLVFRRIPFLVVVPAPLSKTGSEYVTFGSTEAASAVTAYLAQRRRRREVLGPDSAVVRSEPKTSAPHVRDFLSEKSIGTQLRKAMSQVAPRGRRWRAVVLRSFFSTQLESAERAGKTTRTLREAWMGHTTPIEYAYHLGKRLHPERLEEMRKAYAACEPYLLTSPTPSGDAQTDRILRVFLLTSGFSEEEIRKLDLASMSDADIAELARRRVADAPALPRQRIVKEAEVPSMLEQGWLVRSQFNHESYVLERPG